MADAQASGACYGNIVWVQVPSSAVGPEKAVAQAAAFFQSVYNSQISGDHLHAHTQQCGDPEKPADYLHHIINPPSYTLHTRPRSRTKYSGR